MGIKPERIDFTTFSGDCTQKVHKIVCPGMRGYGVAMNNNSALYIL